MTEAMRMIDRPRSAAVEAAAASAGFTPLQARVIAGRMSDRDANRVAGIRAKLSDLDGPNLLPDIEIATHAVAEAIVRGQHLLLISDFDCDGASGHCVVKHALRDCFGVDESRIHSFIGHRLREGYGVTESLTERIIETAPRPALAITIDQGSSDQVRIRRLKDAGVLTVVTDHHGVPSEGPPVDALACVNPARADSRFPDANIAGVHVAWLLCCAVRSRLIEMGYLADSAPKLGHLLDLVALGTLADCVDLARSANNRAVIAAGLRLMNQSECRVAWRSLRKATKGAGPITAQTLGFSFAPMINARGRLDCALGSVDFLMTTDGAIADNLAQALVLQNTERKRLQSEMLRRVWPLAERQVAEGRHALAIFDADGHPGVHGICASRLVEAFGRPVSFFSPKETDWVTGSVRSVKGFHVRNALQDIAARCPEAFRAWGGHAGAGGLTMKRSHLGDFGAAWSELVGVALRPEELVPTVWTDGAIEEVMDLKLCRELSELEPFGKQWEAPVFRACARIAEARRVGDGSHLKLELLIGQERHEGIWFSAVRDDVVPISPGMNAQIAFELDVNEFQGARRLQLLVRHAIPVAR